MNTDTGEIKFFNEGEKIPDAFMPIDYNLATPAQKREMRVHLEDEVSPLGQKLKIARRDRGKYRPHVGAKQLAKMLRRQELIAA